MAETWDESKPAGSRSPTLGDDDIRESKRAIRERAAEDHVAEATENPAFGAVGGYKIGKHKFVTLAQRNTSKVTDSDEVAFVCKEVSGNPEVMLTPPSAGTDRQITKNAGANLNLNSGDFANSIITTNLINDLAVTNAKIGADAVTAAKIGAGEVGSSEIAANAVKASQLDTGAVGANQIIAAGVTPAKLGSFEAAGGNDYYASGDFGGDSKTTQSTTWVDLAKIRFMAGGTFRFYWRYRQDYDNQWGFWRITKNGAAIVNVSDEGTSGSDPWHYRTDNLALVAGDIIIFRAYVGNILATAETNIWLRGANLTGIFEVY